MKKNTLIVGLLTLVSLVLGFGRESFIAFLFGSTQYTDAFYVAMLIPDLVAGWIGYTVTNALIPVLKRVSDQSIDSGKRLVSTIFYYVLAGGLLLSLTSYLLVNQIIHYLAPNFDIIQNQVGAELLRIMAIAIVFSALSGLFAGINNTFEQYIFPSLVGVFYNLFFFLALVLLYRWLGFYALAYGFLAGVIGRCLIQFFPLVRYKRLIFKFQAWHKSIPLIAKAMLPIFLSQALSQVNQIVDRILASGLPYGQITNLNYAAKLGLLSTGLIGGTIATTMYIRFVKSHNENNLKEMGRLYSKGISWILFVGLFISGGLIFFGQSLVSILYYHGKFTLNDLYLTTDLLRLYGIFCFSYMVLPLSTQFFFSYHGGKIIVLSSIVAVFINVTLGYILVHSIGVRGLVIANGISQTCNVLILYLFAMNKIRENGLKNIFRILKLSFPGVILLFIPLGLYSTIVPDSLSVNKLIQVLRGIGAVAAVGIIVALFSRYFLNNDIIKTMHRVKQKIFNRIIGRKFKKKVHAS